MKKVLIVILIVILVLAVLTVAGLLAYRHFVTERIMDKGGIKIRLLRKNRMISRNLRIPDRSRCWTAIIHMWITACCRRCWPAHGKAPTGGTR